MVQSEESVRRGSRIETEQAISKDKNTEEKKRLSPQQGKIARVSN